MKEMKELIYLVLQSKLCTSYLTDDEIATLIRAQKAFITYEATAMKTWFYKNTIPYFFDVLASN